MGYNRNRNIILGRSSTTGLPIVYGGQGNLLIVGKQGSGKTRRIGISNLIRYKGSVLVGTDFKGQLAQMTALYRSAVLKQDVLIIDPFEVFKSPWINTPAVTKENYQLRYGQVNPIDFIRNSQSPLTAAFLIAGAKVPVGMTKEPHWPNAAQLKFVGVLLWVALDPKIDSLGLPRNMQTVWKVLSNPVLEKESLSVMRFSDNPIVAQQAVTFLKGAKGNTEVSGIKSHLSVSLTKTLGEDKIIDTMLDTNINFAEMNKRPITVYIILPGYMAPTHYSFMVLLISIALSQIEQGGLQPFDSEQPPTLFINDEFATLKKFDPIVEAMGRMREYNLKCMTMVQALSQLKAIYGDNLGTIMGTAGCVQLLGGTNDQFTADTISQLCGTQTKIKVVPSFDTRTNSCSESYQAYGIPVIMPDEILRLQLPEQIIKIDGLDPMRELALDPDLRDFPDYLAFMSAIEQGFDPDDAAAWAAQYRPGPHTPPPVRPLIKQPTRKCKINLSRWLAWAGLG